MPISDCYVISDTHIYIWTVTESIDELASLCHSAQLPCDAINGIKALSRQSEKLVEMLLLNEIFQEKIQLSHFASGEPYIEGKMLNISVSHTTGIVAIAVNYERRRIGIDVEKENRCVLRVRDKFLGAAEKCFIEEKELRHNVIAWTAKEALFKAIPESGIDFKENLYLSEFDASTSGRWSYKGVFEKKGIRKEFKIYSQNIGETILTLAIEEK